MNMNIMDTNQTQPSTLDEDRPVQSTYDAPCREENPVRNPLCPWKTFEFKDDFFIDCPFNQKDDAKALGAKWAPAPWKTWYAPTQDIYWKLARWHIAKEDPAAKEARKAKRPRDMDREEWKWECAERRVQERIRRNLNIMDRHFCD